MADRSFTDTLPAPQQGVGPVQPAQQGSWISGLLGLGSQAVSAFSQNQAQANKLETDAAVNDSAKLWYNHAMSTIPGLNATGDAVRQGSVPPEMANLRFETELNSVLQQHPEHYADILSFYHTQGYDSYLFREMQTSRALEAAHQTAIANTVVQDQEQARSLGIQTDGLDDTAIHQLVQVHNKAVSDAIAAKAAQEAHEAARREGQADTEAQNTYLQRSIYQSAQSSISASLDRVTVPLQKFIGAARTEDEFTQLEATRPVIQQNFAAARTQALAQASAQGADATTRSNINRVFDGYEKTINDIFDGPASVIQTRTKAINSVMSQYKLTFTQAAPVYSALREFLGADMVTQMMLNPPAGFQKLMQDQLNNLQVNPEAAKTSFQSYVEHMRGDFPILQHTPEDIAVPAIQTVNGVLRNVAPKINSGDLTQAPDFIKQLATGANYVIDLQSGDYQRPERAVNAMRMLATPQNRTALGKLYADPNYREQAQTAISISRTAAQHILSIAGTNGWKTDTETVYVPTTYGVRRPPGLAPTGQQAIKFRGGQYVVVTESGTPVPPSTRLSQEAEAMNLALTHVTETSQYDSEIPKSATPLSLRNHYANGTPLVNAQGHAEPTPEESFRTGIQTLQNQVRSLTGFDLNATTAQHDGGVMQHEASNVQFNDVLFGENGGNPNPHDSRTGAQGPAQVQPKTQVNPGFGVKPAELTPEMTPEQRLAELQRVGKDYFSAMQERYSGNNIYAMAAYNWGPGNVDRWIKSGAAWNALPKETKDYIERIIRHSNANSNSAQAQVSESSSPTAGR